MRVDPQVRQIVVGKVISELRRQGRISQDDFAARVGISQPSLSRIERGQAAPDVLQFAEMADALGLTVAQLQVYVDQSLSRTRDAAAGATHQAVDAHALWTTALKVAGVVGLAGLAAFAVAAVLSEEGREDD